MNAVGAGSLSMNTIGTPKKNGNDRRRFLTAAALTIVSANFSMTGSADAQSSKVTATATNTTPHTSFASLKQIAVWPFCRRGRNIRPGGCSCSPLDSLGVIELDS
jgi:hypothetical protein